MKITSTEFIRGIVGTNSILSDNKKQIAFIGRSNVGKSSLINSLVQRKTLVKTGKKPGKTTEINFFLINNKFYFVDLPGYGYAGGGKEQIEKIRKLIIWYLTESNARPENIALILDAKVGVTQFDKDVIDILRGENHPYIIVVNKIDKLNQNELSSQVKKIKSEINEAEIVLCSTLSKKGIDHVLDVLTS
jgi:GTP-binding protein